MSQWSYCRDMYVDKKFNKYTVMDNVIEKNDVNLIMQEVKSALDTKQIEWTTDRHGYRSTVDLPIVYNPTYNMKQTKLPITVKITNEILKEKISNQFEKMYGFDKKDISYEEAFLIRYTPDTQDHLASHYDASPLSFVCALNDKDEYKGGGTKFDELDETVKLEKGECLAFSGQQEHSGLPVTDGERWILAGFVNYGPTAKACDTVIAKDTFGSHKYRNLFAETKSCNGCIDNGSIKSFCPENCRGIIENAVIETKKDILHSQILPAVMEIEEISEHLEKYQKKNVSFKVLKALEDSLEEYIPSDDVDLNNEIYNVIENHEPGVNKKFLLHIDDPFSTTIEE